jgi:hypothetical protein
VHSLRVTLLGLSLSLAACSPAGLAQMSAEPTACAAEQLEITESHQPMEGPSSWTAICTRSDGGKQKWFCSKAHERVICTEDPT